MVAEDSQRGLLFWESSNVDEGIFQEMQGLAHDENHWYFSSNESPEIWKVPRYANLGEVLRGEAGRRVTLADGREVVLPSTLKEAVEVELRRRPFWSDRRFSLKDSYLVNLPGNVVLDTAARILWRFDPAEQGLSAPAAELVLGRKIRSGLCFQRDQGRQRRRPAELQRRFSGENRLLRRTAILPMQSLLALVQLSYVRSIQIGSRRLRMRPASRKPRMLLWLFKSKSSVRL